MTHTCPTCGHGPIEESEATRDRVVGRERVGDMWGDTVVIDGVAWCSKCGTLMFIDIGEKIVETCVPKQAKRRKK